MENNFFEKKPAKNARNNYLKLKVIIIIIIESATCLSTKQDFQNANKSSTTETSILKSFFSI